MLKNIIKEAQKSSKEHIQDIAKAKNILMKKFPNIEFIASTGFTSTIFMRKDGLVIHMDKDPRKHKQTINFDIEYTKNKELS